MTATLELNPIPGTEDAAPQEQAAPAAPPPIDELVATMIEGGADVSALTKLYLKLRNKADDLKKMAAAKAGPINKGMTLIENHFLAKMLEMKVDSLKNAEGTPYKTTKTSITIADNSAFVDFVLTRALSGLPLADKAKQVIKDAMIESGQLSLIEARAAKSAVEALMEETKELPPGLNKRAEDAVNVRAST